MKHVILASIGTDGDVHPFLGLGLTLRALGYHVTLATHEHFAPLAAAGELSFRALVSNSETEALISNRAFFSPLRGPVVVARWGKRLIRRQHAMLRELGSAAEAVLVAGPGVVAARVVQEELGVPLVSVVLQPWMIPSVHAPPVMMSGLSLPAGTPRLVGSLYYRLFDGIGGLLIGAELNRLRSSLGFKPVRRIFRWWFSPALVLGMFPGWFGKPQPDWPPQLRLTGFPVNDGRPSADLPDKVRDFCAGGRPPVAFTFGTGMMHATALFRECIEACRLLGTRGILLTRFCSQVPAELPPFMVHCEFAPFQKLFPLCSVVVHHGGIGTTAKALAGGVPQLILPFAFDQLDNAKRVERIRAGRWLKPTRRQAATLAKTLAGMIAGEFAQAVEEISGRFTGDGGLMAAADAIVRCSREMPVPGEAEPR